MTTTSPPPRPTTTRRRLIGAGFGLPIFLVIARAFAESPVSDDDRSRHGGPDLARTRAAEAPTTHDPTAYALATTIAEGDATWAAIQPKNVRATRTAEARATEEDNDR